MKQHETCSDQVLHRKQRGKTWILPTASSAPNRPRNPKQQQRSSKEKKTEQHPWRLHKQEPQFPSRLQTNSPRLIFFTKALSLKGSRLGLKTDRNIPVPTCSVFYFCPSVFVFVGSHFRIYGSRNEVSPFPRNPVFTWNWPVFIPFFIPFLIYIKYV